MCVEKTREWKKTKTSGARLGEEQDVTAQLALDVAVKIHPLKADGADPKVFIECLKSQHGESQTRSKKQEGARRTMQACSRQRSMGTDS